MKYNNFSGNIKGKYQPGGKLFDMPDFGLICLYIDNYAVYAGALLVAGRQLRLSAYRLAHGEVRQPQSVGA
jgi:hypothetical protein